MRVGAVVVAVVVAAVLCVSFCGAPVAAQSPDRLLPYIFQVGSSSLSFAHILFNTCHSAHSSLLLSLRTYYIPPLLLPSSSLCCILLLPMHHTSTTTSCIIHPR
jgi:hypothetical protein